MTDRVGQQFGNYQLLRLIGEGNFADIYLAEHLYLETPAAIKILHAQMKPDSHESFQREARTIAHLQHPHIVRVLDFGIQDQTPYLAMEYMPNGTLRSRHPEGSRLSLEQIVSYVKQIASALDYAHKHHVIHRDVKPENILLNARGEVILSDFGIAVVFDTLVSLSEQKMAGTPIYMAPEQIRDQPCAASDQYALGVIVYEWLCGEPPFRGSFFSILSQHELQAPPSLCARLPHLLPAVEDAVFGALAKDPNQRFVTVEDFASALEEACFATQILLAYPSIEEGSSEYEVQPGMLLVQQPTPSTLPPFAPAQTISRPPLPAPEYQTTPVQSTDQTTALSPIAPWYRQTLLRRVRTFWVEGVLNHSLHGAALLALGLQTQPDAVTNPWHLVFQQPETTPRPLPAGTRITQVYDEAEQELLILGAPGAGKTTLLLELTRDLLARAERNEQHPMPMVFNLSSWAVKRQPLTNWLVEELNSKYLIPRKLAQTLVETDQILPLLDGLDEVAAKERTACIEAINTYRLEHMQPPVVCSRSADYLVQTGRLRLGSAVVVQPLTPQQILGYLSNAGPQLAALRTALQLDADLQALATTPLMLNILILAYQGTPLDQIAPLGTLPIKQQQVFATYVQRMLTSRSTPTRYTPEQTLPWLSFLAQRMKRRNQTVFYIEQIQPDWLVDQRLLRKYDWLAVRLPYILVGVLVGLAPCLLIFQTIWTPLLPEVILLGGLLGWLLGRGSVTKRPLDDNGGKARGVPWYWLLQQLELATLLGSAMGLSFWLYTKDLRSGLVGWLSFALCYLLLLLLLQRGNTRQTSAQRMLPRPVRGKVVLNALLVGLLAGLSNVLGFALSADRDTVLSNGLLFLLLGGLSGGILSALLLGRHATVQPVDRLIWTWQSFGRSLFSKRNVRSTLPIIGIGLLFFTAITLLLREGTITDILTLGLTFGLCYWLLLGFFRGVESATIDDRLRAVPNQGIRHSVLNALRYGLVVALLVGLGGWSLTRTWSNDGLIGLDVGLLAGLFQGGLACLRHYTLRILLWRSGAIPRNYSHFLDAVAERILLYKVGGGYIFVHRLLLDYLATLGTNELTGQRIAVPSAPITATALLPCGHMPRPDARFCGVCGAAVPIINHYLD